MKFVPVLAFLVFCANSALGREIQSRNLVDAVTSPLAELIKKVVGLLPSQLAFVKIERVLLLELLGVRLSNISISVLDGVDIEEIKVGIVGLEVDDLQLNIRELNISLSYQLTDTSILIGQINETGSLTITLFNVKLNTKLSFKAIPFLNPLLDEIKDVQIGVDTSKLADNITPEAVAAIVNDVVNLVPRLSKSIIDFINGIIKGIDNGSNAQ